MTTIVLLPGMDGTGKLFADFVSCLNEQLRVIVVAYPADLALGYAELEAFARDYLPKDEPFFLLGESFSGPVAISLAASKPDGLVGLILCCTFARNPLPVFGFLRNLTGVLPINKRALSLGTPLLLGRQSSKELRAKLKQALRLVPTSTLRARLRAVLDVDVSNEAQKIDVPILYLQACADRVVPKSALQHLRSLSRHINVIKLSGPHLLLQTMPADAAGIVGRFTTGLIADLDLPLPRDRGPQQAAP